MTFIKHHFSNKLISGGHAWSCLCRHTDEASLLAAIDGETFPGGELTSTDSFLVVLTDVFNTVGDRSEVPNVGILITDNAKITEKEAATASAKLQEDAKLKMLLVGLTDRIPESTSAAVSSSPHEVSIQFMLPFDTGRI